MRFNTIRNFFLIAFSLGVLFSAIFGLVFSASSSMAQVPSVSAEAPISSALITKVNSLIDAYTARLTTIFKDLHQHPEIAFTETRTAAIAIKGQNHKSFQSIETVKVSI